MSHQKEYLLNDTTITTCTNSFPDCHYYVRASDADIVRAINLLIDSKGGISLVNGPDEIILTLPIAGLMSNEDGYIVAEKYELINEKAKLTGSALKSPYMTLSFMALLVIPKLKISDKGLFDVTRFKLTSIYNQ